MKFLKDFYLKWCGTLDIKFWGIYIGSCVIVGLIAYFVFNFRPWGFIGGAVTICLIQIPGHIINRRIQISKAVLKRIKE